MPELPRPTDRAVWCVFYEGEDCDHRLLCSVHGSEASALGHAIKDGYEVQQWVIWDLP